MLASSVLVAEDKSMDKAAMPGEQYKALLKEHQDATEVFSKAYTEAMTDEERKKVIANSPWDKFAPRFLGLAQKYPKDPVAVDALVWVLNNSSEAVGAKDSQRAKAIALLLRDHIRSDKLGSVCLRMRFDFAPESETFLRTVLERSPHQEIQALACLALAQFLCNRLRLLDLVQDGPDLAKHYEGLFGKDYLEQLLRQDRAKVAKETEVLFEQAADKYGDVKIPTRGTVGEEAKSELFEIRHLAVGKEAPEIEGEDQNGKKFKLSDCRGKVVLLDFWSQF
jgi:thiol-disulfide isomerase/thioredoxin